MLRITIKLGIQTLLKPYTTSLCNTITLSVSCVSFRHQKAEAKSNASKVLPKHNKVEVLELYILIKTWINISTIRWFQKMSAVEILLLNTSSPIFTRQPTVTCMSTCSMAGMIRAYDISSLATHACSNHHRLEQDVRSHHPITPQMHRVV
jgi:hypothetical protein